MRRLLLLALVATACACHEPHRRECLLLDLAAECPTPDAADRLFADAVTWEETWSVVSEPERWTDSTCDTDRGDTGSDACHGPTMSCCYVVEVHGD